MEIIKQISDRTGVSETQAEQAVQSVHETMRDNLPGGMGDLIGSILSGTQGGPQGAAADALGGGQGGIDLGGLLGGLMGGQGGQGGLNLDDLIGAVAGGGTQGGLNPDGLINSIAQKTGLSPEIAASILPVIIDFIADRLPPDLRNIVTGLIGGTSTGGTRAQGDDGFGLDDIAKGLGGILGGR